MKLCIHSSTSTVQPLKFGNGWVISSNILLDLWLVIHAGMNQIIERGPRQTDITWTHVNADDMYSKYVGD